MRRRRQRKKYDEEDEQEYCKAMACKASDVLMRLSATNITPNC